MGLDISDSFSYIYNSRKEARILHLKFRTRYLSRAFLRLEFCGISLVFKIRERSQIIEEEDMLKRRRNSLKKNVAVLVCVAFISLILPDVTYASSSSSSPEFPFIKQYIFLFSSLFSATNYNLQLGVMAFTARTILAKKEPKPVTPPPPPSHPDKNGDKNSNDDSTGIKGNSKPKKKPNGDD